MLIASVGKLGAGVKAATVSATGPGATVTAGKDGAALKAATDSATGPGDAVRPGKVGAGEKAATDSATGPAVTVSAPKDDAGANAVTVIPPPPPVAATIRGTRFRRDISGSDQRRTVAEGIGSSDWQAILPAHVSLRSLIFVVGQFIFPGHDLKEVHVGAVGGGGVDPAKAQNANVCCWRI